MDIIQALITAYVTISTICFTLFLIGLIRNIRKELSVEKGIATVKQTMKLVYVEQVNGMYHMYDTLNHTFICQAATEKELWDIAESKFPGKSVITLKDAKEDN
jgi:hypothetical protein